MNRERRVYTFHPRGPKNSAEVEAQVKKAYASPNNREIPPSAAAESVLEHMYKKRYPHLAYAVRAIGITERIYQTTFDSMQYKAFLMYASSTNSAYRDTTCETFAVTTHELNSAIHSLFELGNMLGTFDQLIQQGENNEGVISDIVEEPLYEAVQDMEGYEGEARLEEDYPIEDDLRSKISQDEEASAHQEEVVKEEIPFHKPLILFDAKLPARKAIYDAACNQELDETVLKLISENPNMPLGEMVKATGATAKRIKNSLTRLHTRGDYHQDKPYRKTVSEDIQHEILTSPLDTPINISEIARKFGVSPALVSDIYRRIDDKPIPPLLYKTYTQNSSQKKGPFKI